MSTGSTNQPGRNGGQIASGQDMAADAKQDVQISQPHNDRPEGPFEHSGEASGWTKAEETEINEQEQA